MASCYGNNGEGLDLNGNRELILLKCPYLPIEKDVQLSLNSGSKDNATVVLTVFTTEKDYEQGFMLMNDVIVEGKTWPFLDAFKTMEDYQGYFHSHSAFCVKFKDQDQYGDDILGCFYVKPNFPGRCSHICNGGFITNPKYRGCKIGYFMGENFKKLAKDLGYRGSLFNLVFASNAPSVKLWSSLGYRHLATIPKCAILEGEDGYVDAYQFHCDFYEDEDSNSSNSR